ncbi:MAG: glycine zipper 2TM domain-containing protein [Phyllobacterium sp.]
MRFAAIAASALLAMSLAGCETSEQNQRAGTGALVGAGAGALAGQALGRDTKSTVIGAAGGALLGAAVGTATTPRGGGRGENLCRYQRRDGSIYNAPCEGNGGGAYEDGSRNDDRYRRDQYRDNDY